MSTTFVVIIAVAFICLLVLKRFGGGADPPSSRRTNRATSGTSAADLGPSLQWPSLGDFEFEVVGESNYQRTIASLAGDHGTESAKKQRVASLIPEDSNPHDPKAVAVKIEGKVVGYFAREDARSFRRRLSQKGVSGRETTCDALIVGGGTRKSGEKLHYGVRLDIKPFNT